MLKATVIVSDAEVESRSVLVEVLEKHLNYRVIPVAGGAEIIDCIYQRHAAPPEAVLMDVASDPLQVKHYLSQLQTRFPHLPVIALTGYGDMRQAVEALEAGAIDYLSRPVSHQRLKVSLDNAVRYYRLAMEVAHLRRERTMGDDINYLPIDNARLRRLMQQSPNSDESLLFCGEQGVGKEALARAIHAESLRANQAFVSINCAALAERQVWAVLFGPNHQEKDSFLSGKMAGALGGTLFLDEVPMLSPKAQLRLLEGLQYAADMAPMHHHRGEKGIRLMVATSLELSKLRQSGKLIPELLAFLSDEAITIPPLRESAEDIALLAHHFTERFALQENPAVREITPQAIALLKTYDWPGNLFELERVIFRAVMLSEEMFIDVEHLLPAMPPSFVPEGKCQGASHEVMIRSRRMPLTNESGEVRRLRDLEADMINFALNFYEGRISEVARKLGIGRSTLYRKLHDLDIKVA